MPLPEILATVNRHALFTDEMQHWQQRQKQRVREKALYAGVMPNFRTLRPAGGGEARKR